MNNITHRNNIIKKFCLLSYCTLLIMTSVFMKYSNNVHASDVTSAVGDYITNSIGDSNFARMVLYKDMGFGFSVQADAQDFQNFLDGYSSGIGGRFQKYCVEVLGFDDADVKKVTPLIQSLDNTTTDKNVFVKGAMYGVNDLIDGFCKWDAEQYEIHHNNDINMADINNNLDNFNTLLSTWLLSLPAKKGYNNENWSFDEVAPITNIKSIDGIIYDGGKGYLYYIPGSSLGYQGYLYIYFTFKNGSHGYAYPYNNGYQIASETKNGKRITWRIQTDTGTYNLYKDGYNSNYLYSVSDNVNLPVSTTIIKNVFNTGNYHEGDTLHNTDNLYDDTFSLNYNRIDGLYYIPIKIDTSKLTDEERKNCPCEIVSLPQGDFLMLPITQDVYHMPDLNILNKLIDNHYCTQQDFTNQFRSIMNYTVINKDGNVYDYNGDTVTVEQYQTEINNYNKENYVPNGTTLKNIFPFCLPFDISRLLTPFNAEPVTPKFVVNFANFNSNIKFNDASSGSADASSGSPGGGSMDIDFNTLKIDELAKLLRTGEIVLFTISLAIWFFKAVSK